MKTLLGGNDAFFQGALRAGANYFAGYPISPTTEILTLAAERAEEQQDFHFLQAEDEIAAAIAVVSASLAGAKAFTATSGPGFSLMQEAISWGYRVEAPTVFFESQRVGPSTGAPTFPAQEDLLQAMHGAHGTYYPLAFYPNSPAECYTLAVTAFNAAEEAMQPVIFLCDGYVSHLYESVDLEALEVPPAAPRSRLPLGTGKRHFTGIAADEEGIPRTGNPPVQEAWVRKVKERNEEVAKRYPLYEYTERDSDTLLISYGSTSRVTAPLQERFSHFRPIRIFPVLKEELRKACEGYERIVVLEANDGQYAMLVEHAIGREVEKIPLLGGKISLSRIKEPLKEVLGVELEDVL